MTSWTHFSCFSVPKTGPFSGPQNGVILRPLFVCLTGGPKRGGRKLDPFSGGLGLQNETLPGSIRSTFGSRFQPPSWVPLCADQRFSGRSACCRTRGCLTTILHLPCLLIIRRSEAPCMFGFGLQLKAYMCVFVDLTGSLTLVPE